MEDEKVMKRWKVEHREVYGIFRNKDGKRREWAMRVGGWGEFEIIPQDDPQFRYTNLEALFVNGYRMDERGDIPDGRFVRLHFGPLDDDIEVVSQV